MHVLQVWRRYRCTLSGKRLASQTFRITVRSVLLCFAWWVFVNSTKWLLQKNLWCSKSSGRLIAACPTLAIVLDSEELLRKVWRIEGKIRRILAHSLACTPVGNSFLSSCRQPGLQLSCATFTQAWVGVPWIGQHTIHPIKRVALAVACRVRGGFLPNHVLQCMHVSVCT